MRIGKIAERAAEGLFHLVRLAREASSTNSEVQCEGDRDETETGRELWRAARNLGPGGFKHRACDGEHGLLLDLPWGETLGIILGIDSDDAAAPVPDLAEGETAIWNTSDSSGKSIVRCVTDRVEIGASAGGLIIRKDRFTTWWDATPKTNYAMHTHAGVMGGPGSTAMPSNALGDVGSIECDDDHRVK